MENYENDDVSIEQEYPIDIYAEEEAQREFNLEEKINVAKRPQYPCGQRMYNGKICNESHPYKYGDTCQTCNGDGKNPSDPERCVECCTCGGMGFYDPHG